MASQTDATQWTTRTSPDRPRRSLLWWAAGAGVAAGILSMALRRRQSPWQRARNRAGRLAEGAASQWKPLVGVAAAGAAAIAYKRRSKPANWQRAIERAGRIARDGEVKPWMTVATSVGMGLISAYRRGRFGSARRRPVSDSTIDRFAKNATQIVERAKRISKEASKLYPELRKGLVA